MQNSIVKTGFILKSHFRLDSSEARACTDMLLCVSSGRFFLDIMAFDGILHERHGNYEDDSMKMIP
jgi:hypothetical protein